MGVKLDTETSTLKLAEERKLLFSQKLCRKSRGGTYVVFGKGAATRGGELGVNYRLFDNGNTPLVLHVRFSCFLDTESIGET